MTTKISVIIPMYNVKSYIGYCLDSLVEQPNATELAVYVIDDGSTDGSREVVQGYAQRHSNIRLLVQDNQGPGAARNLGLSVANEEFVTFLDADDIIPFGAYSKLLEPLLIDEELEFSTGLMESFPKKQHFHWQKAYESGARVVTSILEAPELIHSGSACNKLFRRASLDYYGSEFPVGVHFEDARVVIPLLLQVKKFCIIPDTVYLYRKRETGGSIMDSLFSRVDNYWDYLELIEQVQALSLKISHEKKRLAEQFNVRGFQGFLLQHSIVLPSKDHEVFRRRAYSVFVDVPAWLIRRNTHNPRHAHPFGLLRAMGKRNEYHELSADTRLRLVPTKPQLGRLQMGDYDTLMRSSGITVWLESAVRTGKNITLEGRISARGLPISEKPNIELELVLGKRRFSAAWKERADRKNLPEGSFSAFMAVVPLKRWPSGEYFPRLAFKDDEITIEERALKTVGFWRNAKAFAYSNFNYTFVSNSKNQIGIRRSKVPNGSIERAKKSITTFLEYWKSDRFFASALVARAVIGRTLGREIWLLGERWDMAQDNSARLFEYLSTSTPQGVKPVYVVEKGTAAFAAMSKFGKVVPHGSLAHKITYVLAAKHISAFDTDTYLKPKSWDKARVIEEFLTRTNIKRVFLQHGVTFRGDGVRGLHRVASGYDLVLTASDREREFFAHELGYGHRAINTGFPRFDSLQRIVVPGKNRVLFAPTWRSELVVPSYSESGKVTDSSAFEASSYFVSIMNFLKSDRLRNFLSATNSELYFLPHYEVREFFQERLDGLENIKIASTDEYSFQYWLRSASVFITDYSSTSFDVALMGTPIVYFGWDPIDPKTGQFYVASYFYYDRDGFGPVAHSTDQVVDHLEDIAGNGFETSTVHSERVKDYFGDVEIGGSSRKVVDALVNLK